MTKLEELIQELCPEGVEYKTIRETVGVNRGRRLTKNQLSGDDEYDVYHGSKDSILGKYNQYNAPAHTTIVVNTGGIGGVKYLEKPFWCSDGSFWLGQRNFINSKFLYYCLSGYESYFFSKKRVGGVPTIDKSVVEDFQIPVPPLPIQQEIVRILDQFTELTTELTTRKKQYEYYRDELLTFDNSRGKFSPKLEQLLREHCPDGVEYKTVEDVSSTLSPKIKIKSTNYLPSGKYPVIDQGQDFIGGYTNLEDVFPCGKYVIFGDHTCTVKYVDFSFAQGADGVKVLVAKSVILPKYLYYCMSNIRMTTEYARHWTKMRSQYIPVPPLPIQQEIVRILDHFEMICTDLTVGLPAEIEARQKQYEYYRDKLLAFTPAQ